MIEDWRRTTERMALASTDVDAQAVALRQAVDSFMSDPRPMRVQRAEMFEASQVPVGDRAARYVASVEKKLIERGMPARVAGMRAREKAPSWVREALAGASAGETQRRAG